MIGDEGYDLRNLVDPAAESAYERDLAAAREHDEAESVVRDQEYEDERREAWEAEEAEQRALEIDCDRREELRRLNDDEY